MTSLYGQPGRISCVVPHCRNTMAGDPAELEFICYKHWRLVKRAYRQTYFRLKRRYKSRPSVSLEIRIWRIWCRLRRAAIERAGGIG